MLRPMTVSGRSRATRGSWAVPEAPASRAMRTPGLINPPVYWPFRLMTEAVVAAPMSKMTIGGVYRSRAATAPATRLAPSWAGSSIRMLSPVFTPGPTTSGLWPVTFSSARVTAKSAGGTTEEITAPSMPAAETPFNSSTR